jgi:hypothetical protein
MFSNLWSFCTGKFSCFSQGHLFSAKSPHQAHINGIKGEPTRKIDNVAFEVQINMDNFDVVK